MLDKRARDQFVIRHGDSTEVMWNDPQRLSAESVRLPISCSGQRPQTAANLLLKFSKAAMAPMAKRSGRMAVQIILKRPATQHQPAHTDNSQEESSQTSCSDIQIWAWSPCSSSFVIIALAPDPCAQHPSPQLAAEIQPAQVYSREFWTGSYVQWSPHGSYLATVHMQGVAVWGTGTFTRIHRYAHPMVRH